MSVKWERCPATVGLVRRRGQTADRRIRCDGSKGHGGVHLGFSHSDDDWGNALIVWGSG